MLKHIFFILLSFAFLSSATLAQENNDAKKLFNEGNAKLKSGDFDGAVVKYDAALAIEKHEYYFYQKGIALKKGRKLEDAILSFKEAVKKNPKFAAGYNALGGAYFSSKDYDKSIANYEKALAENPTLGPAKKGLAAALTAKANKLVSGGNSKDGLVLLNKALENQPKFAQAHIIMAQAYNKDGSYKLAVTAAKNAAKYTKSNRKGAAYFELGLAQRNLGNTAEAKKAFLQAKKDPTYARNAAYELDQLK